MPALLLLVAPVLVGIIGGWLGQCRRPLFLWVDPDYPYLLNALTVAELEAPALTQHPGTPLQVLGAVLLHSVHALSPSSHLSLRERVLSEPELFLSIWRSGLLALYAMALAICGMMVLRATGSLAASLLFQAVPLMSVETLFSLSRVQPEALLVTLGAGATAIILALSVDAASWDTRRTWVLLGVTVGLGVATKLTFVPVALVPLLTLSRRGRWIFAVTAATTSCIVLIPALPQFAITLRWYWSLATHTGYYGAGDPRVLDLTALPGNIWRMVGVEWPACLTAVGGLALGIPLLARPGADAPAARALARVLVATSVSQIAWLLIVAKHARPRYLLPIVVLGGVSLVLMWQLSHYKAEIRTGIRVAVIALVAAGLAGQPWKLVSRGREIQEETKRRQQAASIATSEGEWLIQATPVASQAGAMQYGNIFSAERFAADLRRLYPAFTMWDLAGINAFGSPVDPRRVMTPLPDGGASFRLLGIDDYPVVKAQPAGVRLTKLFAVGRHALYDGRVLPCAGNSSAPFAGFFDSFGLERAEGSEPVFRGRAPRARLLFTGDGRRMTLELEARREGRQKRRLRVSINGQRLVRSALLPSLETVRVSFDPRPGVNEAVLEYGSDSVKSDPGKPAVAFRRLQIRCGDSGGR